MIRAYTAHHNRTKRYYVNDITSASRFAAPLWYPEANPRYLIKPRFWRISRSVPSPKAPDSGLARIRQSVDGLGYLSAAARNLPPLDILATQIVYRLHAPVVDRLNALSYNRARSAVVIFLLYPPRNRRAKLLVDRNAPIFVPPLSLFHIDEFTWRLVKDFGLAKIVDQRIDRSTVWLLIIIFADHTRRFVYASASDLRNVE